MSTFKQTSSLINGRSTGKDRRSGNRRLACILMCLLPTELTSQIAGSQWMPTDSAEVPLPPPSAECLPLGLESQLARCACNVIGRPSGRRFSNQLLFFDSRRVSR